MGIIGIVCNPQSGKDIRRLLTAATTIDDTEKTNILERILITAAAVGQQTVYLMPERLGYGRLLMQKKSVHGYPNDLSQVQVLEMGTTETQADTTHFIQEMCDRNADVLIVLGGDGTNRAAAKGAFDIPIISLSTGTNNVYPEMLEGTVVGLAASAIACGIVDIAQCTTRSKIIEVQKNDEPADLALIDLVFCRNPFIGSRAIWDAEEIDQILVTQCHMATIGFSSLVGAAITVEKEDFFGAMAEFSTICPNRVVPMGAGSIQPIQVKNAQRFLPDTPFERVMEYQGTIALDGEREITFNSGDRITCTLKQNGPLRVNVRKTIQLATENGFFKR